jgi:hypothetical protein
MVPIQARRTTVALAAVLLSVAGLPAAAVAQTRTDIAAASQTAIPVTHYRTVKVDGVDIFYREAGPAGSRRTIPVLARARHRITRSSPIPSLTTPISWTG